MVAEIAVPPFTGPPCAVSLVVLEFSGEEDGDETLVDSTLDEDDGDQA